jgi:EamA domain-containing membrane protein RarD
MTVNDSLRAIAGFFVLVSVALGYFVHPAFLLFTAFVGANLLQSGFSKWCPMMVILRKAGVKDVLSEPKVSCCAGEPA